MWQFLVACGTCVIASTSRTPFASSIEAAVFSARESALIRFRVNQKSDSSKKSLILHGQCTLTRKGNSTVLWAKEIVCTHLNKWINCKND